MSLGQIKDYTPNFNLIIPRFDIATWHDYMESNFRSIDALFFNMFGINQYRGEWQNSTTYQVGDVLFIGDPNSQYTGRLVKVLVIHTTAANDSFDVYYAHNPINYDLFMDAAAAEQAAKLARDWAIKTDGKVQGLDYSAKYYANLITPISSEIVNVSNISSEIVNVSSISSNITSVDANFTNINIVAGMKPDIDDVVAIKTDIEWIADNDYIVTNVSNNSTKITTVANNINSVNTNATNITDINTNASNISSINTTATNISDINTTALNINDINTAANISNDITIAANIASDITSVVNNATNINSVAANNTNISAVANNETNINAVASNSSNINTVSTNISDVNTAATNIVAIQNAPTYATNAANSASLAQDWAVKMNGLVAGEDYSAKYWADQARQSAAGAVVDEISINRNSDDELQTIGVINQNATTIAIKTWTGTKAQYDSLKNNIRYYAWGGDSYYTTVAPDSIQTSDKLYNSSGIELPYTIDAVSYNSTLNQYEMTIEDSDGLYYELIRNSLTTYYDITDIDNNTLYNITDDMQADTYEAYSKNETDTLISTALNNTLSTLYPVGSIYIGTQTTCPLATLISGSTWELVAQNRALWGGDGTNANTTIAAGLPNITGSIFTGGSYGSSIFSSSSGFVQNGSNSGWRTNTVQYSETGASDTVSFDASRSSSIYGQSNTVQPPAYVVNIWRRTA